MKNGKRTEPKIEQILSGLGDLLRPPPQLDPVQWAEIRRTMPGDHSPSPGPYRISKTPYIRDILSALAPQHPAKRVTVVAAAQLGKSTVLENLCGYLIETAPSPIMVVSPSDSDAAEVHSVRLSPMFESIPELSNRIYSESNIVQKQFVTFPGGQLFLRGSGSPSKMRGKSIRYLFLDEVDAYPATTEGDPLQLFTARTTTYGDRAKIYLSSTPTDEETSKIWSSYMSADQHELFVKFPCCQTYQRLHFDQLLSADKSESREVVYQCSACGEEHPETVKHELFQSIEYRPWIEDEEQRRSILESIRGDKIDDDDPAEPSYEETFNPSWVDVATPTNGQHLGYRIPGMYAPYGWLSWKTLKNEHSEAVKTNDSTKLQAFVNTRLALPWADDDNLADINSNELGVFVEQYHQGQVPDNVGLLTAGVDVQKDRLEALIVGWDSTGGGYHIQHRIFSGDTSNRNDGCYKKCLEFLQKPVNNVTISATCWDSNYNTDVVMAVLRPYSNQKIWPVQGSKYAKTSIWPLSGRSKKSKYGGGYYSIGSTQAKLNILNRLSLTPGQPGCLHFPSDIPQLDEYFKQLTAERLKIEYRNGSKKKTLEQTRKRNEIIDLWGYALAARTALENQGLNLEQEVEKRKQNQSLKKPVRVLGRKRPKPTYEW